MDNKSVIGSQAQVSEANFISQVYMWMALGLAVSAAGCLWLMTQPALLQAVFTKGWVLFALVAVELGLVFWLSLGALRMSSGLASAVFLGYSFLNGLTLTLVLLVYTGVSVLSTFAITAGTFLFFSIYGATTKKDLTSIGSLCFMGVFGLIIASIVNWFLKSPALYWITTYAGVAIFMGLIAYDTQKLKSIYAAGSADTHKNMAIIGALALYLDFINLFILLLRIFGRRRS